MAILARLTTTIQPMPVCLHSRITGAISREQMKSQKCRVRTHHRWSACRKAKAKEGGNAWISGCTSDSVTKPDQHSGSPPVTIDMIEKLAPKFCPAESQINQLSCGCHCRAWRTAIVPAKLRSFDPSSARSRAAVADHHLLSPLLAVLSSRRRKHRDGVDGSAISTADNSIECGGDRGKCEAVFQVKL